MGGKGRKYPTLKIVLSLGHKEYVHLPLLAEEDSFLFAWAQEVPLTLRNRHLRWEPSFWQYVNDEQGIKKKPVHVK